MDEWKALDEWHEWHTVGIAAHSLDAFNSVAVMAVDSMLRGKHGRKLEAGDFTTRLITGASASLAFEASSFKGNQTSVSPKGEDREGACRARGVSE
jgi:hypothetical protein